MAEQTFRSPGFFEQEIDLSGRTTSIEGTPAGIIGTSDKGPAFIPVTLGTQRDFDETFGSLNPERFGPYAVQQWMQNRTAVTFTRVLGAGANSTSTNIANTKTLGVVRNAGFVISGTDKVGGVTQTDLYSRARGVVKFLAAVHHVQPEETMGFPVFTDNDSFNLDNDQNPGEQVNLIRAMMLFPTGTTALISPAGGASDPGLAGITPASSYVVNATDGAIANSAADFLLILSSSAATFVNELGALGGNKSIKIFSASLNPTSENYISKILNTDPKKFQSEQHLLYADFSVENELASTANRAVAILSGNLDDGIKAPPGTAGKYQDLFGRFDTRYTTPKTTKVISQPYGDVEYALFNFETLDDGAYGNDNVKVSISNLVASNDPKNKFCKFDVYVRRFSDTDTKPQVIEQYSQCNLDPTSDRYIARLIGDKKVVFDFDAEIDDERRLVISGKYPNVSKYIRVLPTVAVNDGDVPEDAMPFGFKGIPTLKTTDSLTAYSSSVGGSLTALTAGGRTLGGTAHRLIGVIKEPNGALYGVGNAASQSLSASIVPPLPFRFKVTRGATTGTNYEGDPGTDERADTRYYWGVKFTRMAETASLATPVLNPNVSSTPNPLVSTYTKFLGIEQLDTLVTGSGADAFNNNKFTLARVALGPDTDVGTPTGAPTAVTQITGTAAAHILGSVYVRNGEPYSLTAESTTQESVVNTAMTTGRVTLATVLASSAVTFNRFTPYAKFTLPFYGGFDGWNILDPDIQYGNDKSTSQDALAASLGGSGQAAEVGLTANLYDTTNTNPMGAGLNNNSIASFRTAVRLNTDPFIVYTNLLAVPDVKDPLVADYAGDRIREYSKGMFIMDIPEYGMKNGTTSTRLFGGESTLRADVAETAEQFAGRTLDNNYVATYFPSVVIEDSTNNRRVTVPPSVAALGAIGFNDKVSYPWFAPAGFNRGALGFVKNVGTRLSQADRDTLYDNRINPIATFPTGGFVIFGQKTLQQAATALDRVNVRRMLLEVKRLVAGVARNLLFEQNNATTRNRFVAQITPLLALVQIQAGIESFSIVCNNSNNSDLDAEQNRMNGRIVVVPTRAIEFIAIDFIITNAGVSFE